MYWKLQISRLKLIINLLIHAFQQTLEKSTARQARHLSFLSQFLINIAHITERTNTVADSLSQIDTISFLTYFNAEELIAAQKQDKELQSLIAHNPTSLVLRQLEVENGRQHVCDTSSTVRPFVPPTLRRQCSTFSKEVHNLAVAPHIKRLAGSMSGQACEKTFNCGLALVNAAKSFDILGTIFKSFPFLVIDSITYIWMQLDLFHRREAIAIASHC